MRAEYDDLQRSGQLIGQLLHQLNEGWTFRVGIERRGIEPLLYKHQPIISFMQRIQLAACVLRMYSGNRALKTDDEVVSTLALGHQSCNYHH